MESIMCQVELKSNKQMGTYLWSIYSLVKERTMGSAQWTHSPYFSSLCPVFQFKFDMEYTEVSAVCEGGSLVEFNYGDQNSGSELTFQSGHLLSWSPVDNDKLNQNIKIYFTIHTKDKLSHNGVLYIEHENDPERGWSFYTASLVGTGLHLSPDKEGDGGVISLVENTETVGAED